MQNTTALRAGTELDFGFKVRILDGPVRRTGSWQDYLAEFEGAMFQVQEYCPLGVFVRGAGEAIAPAGVGEDWEQATQGARHRFYVLADVLSTGGGNGDSAGDDVAPNLANAPHPGIRPAHLWTAEDDSVMALVAPVPQGRSLAQWLADGSQFTPESVMGIAGQLASALTHAHERLETTHNDIRPDTVSLHEGQIQLTHFGLDDRPFIRLLQSNANFVHPPYSAPELHDSSLRQVLTPRTDIYGASALLYRLMSGRDAPAWQGRSPSQFDSKPLEIPGSDAYPPEFVAAVVKGLSVDPANGFRTCAEWLRAMALSPELRIAPPGVAEVFPPDPLRTWGAIRRGILAVLALAALGGGAYGLNQMMRPKDPPIVAPSVAPASAPPVAVAAPNTGSPASAGRNPQVRTQPVGGVTPAQLASGAPPAYPAETGARVADGQANQPQPDTRGRGAVSVPAQQSQRAHLSATIPDRQASSFQGPGVSAINGPKIAGKEAPSSQPLKRKHKKQTDTDVAEPEFLPSYNGHSGQVITSVTRTSVTRGFTGPVRLSPGAVPMGPGPTGPVRFNAGRGPFGANPMFPGDRPHGQDREFCRYRGC